MPDFRYCPLCAGELVTQSRDGIDRLVCSAEGCDFIHWGNPTPVVAGIVQQDDAVILVRSKGWPETWYGLVTGFLERIEHPAAGILREVREELGLDGEVAGFVGHYPFQQMNQIIIAYHVVVATGRVELGDELADFRRVPVAKLRPWPFATGEAVRDWLAGGAGGG